MVTLALRSLVECLNGATLLVHVKMRAGPNQEGRVPSITVCCERELNLLVSSALLGLYG